MVVQYPFCLCTDIIEGFKEYIIAAIDHCLVSTRVQISQAERKQSLNPRFSALFLLFSSLM